MISDGYAYWDDEEYEFFKSLDDNDKLLYIYDLFINDEFDYSNLESDIEVEFEDDSDSVIKDVQVVFSDDSIKIIGNSLTLQNKVATDLFLNGLILTDKDTIVKETKDGIRIILSYKLIGISLPISLNWHYVISSMTLFHIYLYGILIEY